MGFENYYEAYTFYLYCYASFLGTVETIDSLKLNSYQCPGPEAVSYIKKDFSRIVRVRKNDRIVKFVVVCDFLCRK